MGRSCTDWIRALLSFSPLDSLHLISLTRCRPIDMFVTYEGRRPADIAQSKFAVRHMVATEIEAECAARQQDAIEKGTTGKKAGASSSSFFGSKKRKAPEEEHEDHQQPLEAMYHDDEPPVRDELTRVQNDGGVEAKEKTKEKVDIVEKVGGLRVGEKALADLLGVRSIASGRLLRTTAQTCFFDRSPEKQSWWLSECSTHWTTASEKIQGRLQVQRRRLRGRPKTRQDVLLIMMSAIHCPMYF